MTGLGITLYTLLTSSPTPIPVANGVHAQARHINNPSSHTDQRYTRLMTFNKYPLYIIIPLREILRIILVLYLLQTASHNFSFYMQRSTKQL